MGLCSWVPLWSWARQGEGQVEGLHWWESRNLFGTWRVYGKADTEAEFVVGCVNLNTEDTQLEIPCRGTTPRVGISISIRVPCELRAIAEPQLQPPQERAPGLSCSVPSTSQTGPRWHLLSHYYRPHQRRGPFLMELIGCKATQKRIHRTESRGQFGLGDHLLV